MASSQGYGQQDPVDSTSDYNVRQFQIDQAIAKLSTAKVVRVITVDTNGKTVDVNPLVDLLDGQGNATQQGTIYGLHYGGTQWGDSVVNGTPKAGDIGIIICADRDISGVKAAKGRATPGSRRKLDAADGIYLGGIPGLNSAPAQSITMDANGIKLSDRNSNVVTMESGDITLDSNGTKVQASSTTQRVNVTASNGLWVNGVQITVP